MALNLVSALNFPTDQRRSTALPPLASGRKSPKFVMASTIPLAVDSHVHKPFGLDHEVHAHKIEVMKSLDKWAEDNLLIHLKPVEKCWQPQDFLPDPANSDEQMDQIIELKERAKEIPDDYFVVLVGEMVTEEALPTYQTMLNTFDGTRDVTGMDTTPWAIWTRGWTSEENRHGDLLNKYLYLSGRVDMRQIEKTIQYLISGGMKYHNSEEENDPYRGFIYTSFQERATFISHGKTASLAKDHGNMQLAQICGTIASDEKRHEIAYTKIIEKLFEVDPDQIVITFADMMKDKIVMPGRLMYDGRDENLFQHFSVVAQRLGVYTATDYTDILEHLIGKWKVDKLSGLSAAGRQARDYVCGLPKRFRSLEERAQTRVTKTPKIAFSWIYGREV